MVESVVGNKGGKCVLNFKVVVWMIVKFLMVFDGFFVVVLEVNGWDIYVN